MPKLCFRRGFGVVALLVADYHHRTPVEPGQAACDGRVFGKSAVAGQREVILKQVFNIFEGVRPLRMAGDQHFLPRRQLGIGGAQQALHLLLHPAYFIGDIEGAAVRQMAQFFDLAFEFGNRFFEFEE